MNAPKAEINFPKIFLIISFVFGLIYCFTIPPVSLNDEHRHFLRAYSYAYGKVYDDVYYPKELYDLSQRSLLHLFGKNNNKDPFGKNEKYNLNNNNFFKDIFKQREKASQLVRVSKNRADVYTPLVYWPAIIVIYISEIFKLPYLLIFYLCRISILTAANLIIYSVIKNTPQFKCIFLLMSLLPVCLTHRAAVNADGLTFAYIFYFLSLVLKYRNDEIDSRALFKLSSATLLTAISKIAYIPLIFLSLLIKDFKNKNIKYSVYFIIFPLALSALWAGSISSKFDNNKIQYDTNKIEVFKVAPPNAEINAKDKISGIIEKPEKFMELLLKTAPHLADDYLSHFTSMVIVPYVETNFLLAFFCLIIMFFNNNQNIFSKKEVLFIHLINLALFLVIIFIVYLTWTTTKDEYITGIQPRYFIANTLLLLMTIKTRATDEQIRNVNIVSIFAFIALNLSGVMNVIEKCYEF